MYPGVECVASRETTSTSCIPSARGGGRQGQRQREDRVVKGVKVRFRLLRFQFARRETERERERAVPADVPARVRDQKLRDGNRKGEMLTRCCF